MAAARTTAAEPSPAAAAVTAGDRRAPSRGESPCGLRVLGRSRRSVIATAFSPPGQPYPGSHADGHAGGAPIGTPWGRGSGPAGAPGAVGSPGEDRPDEPRAGRRT